MRVKRHSLDIYGAELFRATSKAELREIRSLVPFKIEAPGAAAATWFEAVDRGPFTVPHIVFYVDPKRGDTLDLIELCAHEATHGAGQLFEHLAHTMQGIDEPHAYLIGWLTRWLITDLI